MDEISEVKNGKRTSKNKCRNANESRKGKRAKKNTGEINGLHVESDMVIHQDAKESSKENQFILRRKPKENEKVCSEANIKEKDVPSLLQGTDPLTNGKETASIHVTPSVNPQKSSERRRSSGRSDKSSNKTNKVLVQSKKWGGQIAAKFETSKVLMNTEQPNDVSLSTPNANLMLSSYDNELPDRLVKRTYKKNSKKLLSSLKKVKFSADDNHDGTPLTAKGDGATKVQASEEIQGATNQTENKVLGRNDKSISSLDGRLLVKCSTSLGTSHCAFCQSSEESEVHLSFCSKFCFVF